MAFWSTKLDFAAGADGALRHAEAATTLAEMGAPPGSAFVLCGLAALGVFCWALMARNAARGSQHSDF